MKITKLSSNEIGSHIVAVGLAIFVVGALGFTSYRVYESGHKSSGSSNVASTSAVVAPPATIKTKAQLSQAAASLSAMQNQLNSSLDTSSLNTYIQGTL